MKKSRIIPLPRDVIDDFVQRALQEDIGPGDVTTDTLVDPQSMAKAILLSRVDSVVAGVDVARCVFQTVEPLCTLKIYATDGCCIAAGDTIMEIRGPARALLSAERVALNFMQRMMGIATLTHRFVARVAPWKTRILDTRKTTPTLRCLEKYAVLCGGGVNHRRGLYDMVLIKDNHRALWRRDRKGKNTLADAVREARRRHPGVPIEIEVESLAEMNDALRGKPDWILLDNIPPVQLVECVAQCNHRCKLEASGGITLANVAAIAATGVDAISLGCLTHSAPAVDLSLEIIL